MMQLLVNLLLVQGEQECLIQVSFDLRNVYIIAIVFLLHHYNIAQAPPTDALHHTSNLVATTRTVRRGGSIGLYEPPQPVMFSKKTMAPCAVLEIINFERQVK